MVPTTRRHLLRSVPVALSVGIAGCAGLDVGSASPPTVETLRAENENTAEHTVFALLLTDGEPVFADSVELAAYNPETNNPRRATFEGVPTDEPVDTLYAWRDDQRRDDWQKADLTQTGNECEDVSIRIRNEESVPDEPLTLRHSLIGCE